MTNCNYKCLIMRSAKKMPCAKVEHWNNGATHETLQASPLLPWTPNPQRRLRRICPAKPVVCNGTSLPLRFVTNTLHPLPKTPGIS